MDQQKKTNCRFCEKDGVTRDVAHCYLHCQERADGKHAPSFHSSTIAEDCDTDPGFLVIDINCKYCGSGGSVKVDVREVIWE